jgi:hypothetical protein
MILFLGSILMTSLPVWAAENNPQDTPTPLDPIHLTNQPNLPDFTHQHLATFAAQSHGNSPDVVDWISQGAYNEDHQPIPTFGWHSWDPDTGEYWWSPLGDGPAIERANTLFWEAVNLYPSNPEAGWKKFGQSLHLLQDLSTPAHAHADAHICLIGDCDAYETWLGDDDLVHTWDWINAHPPGFQWDMSFEEIPDWAELTDDLHSQLEAANLVYGGWASGQGLWESGLVGIDPVLFQLIYLMAESADNYNSGGVWEFPGEVYNGDLSDPAYLTEMRDTLLPFAVVYSTAWIDYFEHQIGIPDVFVYLPVVNR